MQCALCLYRQLRYRKEHPEAMARRDRLKPEPWPDDFPRLHQVMTYWQGTPVCAADLPVIVEITAGAVGRYLGPDPGHVRLYDPPARTSTREPGR